MISAIANLQQEEGDGREGGAAIGAAVPGAVHHGGEGDGAGAGQAGVNVLLRYLPRHVIVVVVLREERHNA